ncbi:MAG: hypothetical protein HY777_12030 [Betaproteobacteria bacterium]|nr:hypothetical protein [Betaproteobacteria bacterium]
MNRASARDGAALGGTPDRFLRHWLTNTLLDDGFIAKKWGSWRKSRYLTLCLSAWLSEHFDIPALAARNEA